MRFRIHSLGCKVNIYESEALTCYLQEKGWTISLDNEIPDVEIVNTCTVTSTSDSKSLKMIRSVIKNNPHGFIIAMGCSSQFNPATIASIKGLDIVLGTNNRKSVYDLVTLYRGHKLNEPLVLVEKNRSYLEYEDFCLSHLSKHTRGFVKIQDGCNNFCTYCAIPYARGVIRSRNAESIKNEIELLVRNGVKEIIISGINTGTYGQDLKDSICPNLATLIKYLMDNIPDLFRLRISSIELMEITDDLLHTIKQYDNRIANHFHIPLQSGSDTVLKRMNRKYNTKTYFETIEKIRNLFKNVAITTDCLAGFVGETEEEFQETMNFIQRVSFSEMHIFPYSRRFGTIADKLEPHLDPKIINERARKMISLATILQHRYEQQFIGSDQIIIAEQVKHGYWVGHTSNYLEVNVKTDKQIKSGDICNITINQIIDGIIYGTLKEETHDF